jgi:RHS repeat-associated protein
MTWTLAGNQIGDLEYSYDADGRAIEKTGSMAATNLPQAVTGNTFNADNEMTSFNGTALTYDANGNLMNDGTNTYSWDARNHMSAIAGAVSASFVYGPLGRRMNKTINGTATSLLYDGLNPIQELQNGSPSANMLTGLGIDEYFQRTDSSGTTDYLDDALGSTLALTDSTGAVQTSYSYDPFGNTTASGASSTNPFQFTGRENDGTRLYYHRARYYSPTLERFVAQDPEGFEAGDPNLYGYTTENPISYKDPYGLDAYLCHRPIKHIPFEFGIVHHEYVCVVSSNGTVECGGLTTNGSWFGGSGVIETDRFRPSSCTLQSKKKCMDECITTTLNDMAPPTYNLGNLGGGENCQEYAHEILDSCESECSSSRADQG